MLVFVFCCLFCSVVPQQIGVNDGESTALLNNDNYVSYMKPEQRDDETFLSFEYHKDSDCKSNMLAQRYFKHQECFNLFYNADLDPDTNCEISINCFTNPFNGDLECPHASSLNSTHFVNYPRDSIAVLTNPYQTCGAITIPIVYELGACYISDFYPGCYFVVTVVGNDDNYDDSDSDELDVYYFSTSYGSIGKIPNILLIILFAYLLL